MEDFFQILANLQLDKKEFEKQKYRWCFLHDEEARKKLTNHFLPLALKISSAFATKYHFELFDLFNEAYIAIYGGLKYYNYKKADMSTFVYKCIVWHLKDYIQRNCAPVKYSLKKKKEMKKLGISMNAVYLSELDEDYFINEETPFDILIKKSKNGKN